MKRAAFRWDKGRVSTRFVLFDEKGNELDQVPCDDPQTLAKWAERWGVFIHAGRHPNFIVASIDKKELLEKRDESEVKKDAPDVRNKLKKLILRAPSYYLHCDSCGVEVHAPSKDILLRFCSDWRIQRKEEMDGPREYIIYDETLCPHCYKEEQEE